MIALLLLVVLIVLGATLMVQEYGHPALDNYRSRCPQCTRDELVRIDGDYQDRRLRAFRCSHCGTTYQEQLDGTLLRL